MAEIYLTGAVSTTPNGNPDWDEPWAWQDDIKDECDDHDFIQPFFLTKYGFGDDEVFESPEKIVEPALDRLADADGMLIRYDAEVNMPGAHMEVRTAYQNGVPVVIWDITSTDRRVSPWMQYHTRYTHEDRDQAVACLLMYAGESAEEVIGK